ncbi:MAG: hypothetical protein KKG76_11035 [Euryarchaeota archaeon]|nr:hypothetical protein [Euryarchaeota archaeon]
MSARRVWAFSPNSGGKKIPDLVRIDVKKRINDVAEQQLKGIERLRNSPIHLCRLRYFDKDKWGFAWYNYSNEKYELATYPDGEFFGKPEDAFLASAAFY